MKQMTENEKTQYIRSALGLSGVAVNDYMAEMIWRMYELLQEKGGDFNLRDAAGIEAFMNKKFNLKQDRKEERQQEVLNEMKAKLEPLHTTLDSILMEYIRKYWTNSNGHPSVEDFIRKKKLNNKDISVKNVFNAIAKLRNSYASKTNWVEVTDTSLTQFIENELSATKQKATSEPQA